MKFFFDNNLSPHLAHAIRELSKKEGSELEVIHLRDRFAPNAPDLQWIGALAADGPWYIVSIDRFSKCHDAEREALRRAGHTVYILDHQWAAQAYWAQADRIVRWWPQILKFSPLVSQGAFRVPWHHSPKAKFAALRL